MQHDLCVDPEMHEWSRLALYLQIHSFSCFVCCVLPVVFILIVFIKINWSKVRKFEALLVVNQQTKTISENIRQTSIQLRVRAFANMYGGMKYFRAWLLARHDRSATIKNIPP